MSDHSNGWALLRLRLRKYSVWIGGTLVLALIGCGGGSSSSSPSPPPPSPPPPQIPDRPLNFHHIVSAGLDRAMVDYGVTFSQEHLLSGGIAAGDYDNDGDIDLYVVGQDTTSNQLFENDGRGYFTDVASELGVDKTHWGAAPAFGDYDGDGDLDLFVGGLIDGSFFFFENRLEGSKRAFVDATESARLTISRPNIVSALFFDYDRDGWLDLFLSHWQSPKARGRSTQTLWRNNGDKTFQDFTVEAGVSESLVHEFVDWTFTPSLADIDMDGDSDLLIAADFDESQIFRNNDDGTFTQITDIDVITDQNGMGSAVADFDNDGDLDWFVTSIHDLETNEGELIDGNIRFGNRLYENLGDGVFVDSTDKAGVANGGWGWGSCAVDFDNDGYQDIVHVNGWGPDRGRDFRVDRMVFFHNTGNGLSFVERGTEIGLLDRGQGRGIACFDAERDGDIDIAIINNGINSLVYYRNVSVNDNNHLTIQLEGLGTNRFGIGALITVTGGGTNQIRTLGGNNNYSSHNPLEVHFGLGGLSEVDVKVRWVDGSESKLDGVQANQLITIKQTAILPRLTVVRGKGAGTYQMGDQIELTANAPEKHYHFSHWTSLHENAEFGDRYASTTTLRMPSSSTSVRAHFLPGPSTGELSVARRWNEVLLQAIRLDFARPTVHARNLFHTSAAMFDTWSLVTSQARPWLINQADQGLPCAIADTPEPLEQQSFINKAISYASYRLLRHRFQDSPGAAQMIRDTDSLMNFLGMDPNNESMDVTNGQAASFGNFIAHCYIEFGMQDGANEEQDYANLVYEAFNPALLPRLPGNPNIVDLDRWQPLSLAHFIDQAGNPIDSEPDFLSAEWGRVTPFALSTESRQNVVRDDGEYVLYHDPGPPPSITSQDREIYQWAHSLVAVWSSHLNPKDGVRIDISPRVDRADNEVLPMTFSEYRPFYDAILTRQTTARTPNLNPITRLPYSPQDVPRGDYVRVLAEYWADGPDSETPPGHWFVILNAVNDDPQLERKWQGSGTALDRLEWDIKSYLVLAGAMHDSAIAAWSIKGWYDYIRPISAIRAMADLGQSSDSSLTKFNSQGLPLVENLIELVDESDPLAGSSNEHVGKLKLYAWRGPTHIQDPAVDVAGVGWILAENWWPYQRPTFVTPPFAGYVSGHSTYSRAAAEVLGYITGSEFFPGGEHKVSIPRDNYLVFERGPSEALSLHWASYLEAANDSALSRIWGGIHPPVDDLPGRILGKIIGREAFLHAQQLITN